MKDVNRIIDIDSFEQLFSEKKLENGWILFKKNKISDIIRKSKGEHEFTFETEPQVRLILKRRGSKISWDKCSCGETLCEHLCAALFYLSQNRIDFSRNEFTPGRKVKGKNERSLFQAYNKTVKEFVKKSIHGRAGQTLKAQIKKEIKKTFDFDPLVFELVYLLEILKANGLSKETDKELILDEGISTLQQQYDKGLEKFQKEAWIEAVQKCSRDFKKLPPFFVIFLVSRALNFVQSAIELEELKKELQKSKPASRRDQLDFHQVAIYLVQYREAVLLKKKKKSENELTVESSIAIVECQISLKKEKEAFSTLKRDYEKLKIHKGANFLLWLEYLVKRSRDLGNKKMELFFSREIMLNDVVIPVSILERIKKLLGKNERKAFFDLLIRDLKKQLPEMYFTRLVQILESENRLTELMDELKKQNGKFWLVHRVAMKMLPVHSEQVLKIYKKHLVETLYEARESYFQEQIFDRAKEYLGRLPLPVSARVTEDLLIQISRNNFIYEKLRKYLQSILINES